MNRNGAGNRIETRSGTRRDSYYFRKTRLQKPGAVPVFFSYPPATMVGAASGRVYHDVRLAEGWVRIVVKSDPIVVPPFRGCDYIPLSPTPAERAKSADPINRRGNEVPAWVQSLVDAPLPPAGSGRYVMAVSYGWPIPVVGYWHVNETGTPDEGYLILPSSVAAWGTAALILAGMWELALIVRSRIRVKRGVCSTCAYPVTSSGAWCPECGAVAPEPGGTANAFG